jgi:hypothetical protein
MDMALSNDKRIRKATKENIKMNQQCPTGAPLSQRRGAGLPAGTSGGEVHFLPSPPYAGINFPTSTYR